MESRGPSDLSLPYGRIATWGIAVSVVVTGAFLLAAPFSPVDVAARALDGRPGVRSVLPLEGPRLPTAAEMSRRAVEEVLGRELGVELSREWARIAPELGAELSREWVRIAPELGAELSREWTAVTPELREEMRRELRRLLVGIDVGRHLLVVDGG